MSRRSRFTVFQSSGMSMTGIGSASAMSKKQKAGEVAAGVGDAAPSLMAVTRACEGLLPTQGGRSA